MLKQISTLTIMTIVSCICWSCSTPEQQSIQIHPLPVDAFIDGDILKGPSALNDPNRFIWGGSVLKGDDGRYHMIYNTWECGDSIPQFTDSWVLHSKLGYAVSDYPDKGFEFQKIILQGRRFGGDTDAWDAQMVTNPHLKKFNGKYYLYYVGSKEPGVQPEGSKGENLNQRNRVQQMQCIGVIEFDCFEDLLASNFKRPNTPILSPRTRVKADNVVNPSPEGTVAKPDNIIVVNPSVVQRPSDGKYLLYFKGNIFDPHWKGVHGVAIADSPLGPFQPSDNVIFEVMMDDGKIASAEDPFVWYHQRSERFYAVIKDFSGQITGVEPGLAMLESKDGINWPQPANPFFMKKELQLKSGEMVKVNRLERPQLLLDEAGNPMVLYAACSLVNINPRQDGASFNIQIPLNIK
ncbi:glycoside hydrolase family protein [Carboxylicivirga sediminis]|uniref:Glycoside hydrolase family protein n=1 Tax=Carboxylicivirga sediminis TaxID=2006564 RepID=A0A941F7E9_9BACT|nr:glycoside hydrolase family protein [Carboxylicivirga sediminis]MBR8537812.1 glycoside hydrolase family protein [Carboxylicivirga sediminis]